jgi:hypothetical protein
MLRISESPTSRFLSIHADAVLSQPLHQGQHKRLVTVRITDERSRLPRGDTPLLAIGLG